MSIEHALSSSRQKSLSDTRQGCWAYSRRTRVPLRSWRGQWDMSFPRAHPSERGVVHPARGVLKASEVAAEHLDICADVRRKGYRLSALKMRVARHDTVGVFFSLAVESVNKSVYETRDLRHVFFEIEP